MRSALFIIVLFVLGHNVASAQETIVKNKIPFKPPVVKSEIGIRSGKDTVHKEEAVQLVKLPLTVKDARGTSFKIENYRLLYRKIGYVENPETGKPEMHYTTVASRFTETPLPKVWSDNIQYTLSPGEELFFFEILVADKNGNRFYAPDLKIFIK